MALYDSHGEPTRCPHCKTTWREERNIVQTLWDSGSYMSQEAAFKAAMAFGNPFNHFWKNAVSIYDTDTDPVTHYQCKSCNERTPRLTVAERQSVRSK